MLMQIQVIIKYGISILANALIEVKIPGALDLTITQTEKRVNLKGTGRWRGEGTVRA